MMLGIGRLKRKGYERHEEDEKIVISPNYGTLCLSVKKKEFLEDGMFNL